MDRDQGVEQTKEIRKDSKVAQGEHVVAEEEEFGRWMLPQRRSQQNTNQSAKNQHLMNNGKITRLGKESKFTILEHCDNGMQVENNPEDIDRQMMSDLGNQGLINRQEKQDVM